MIKEKLTYDKLIELVNENKNKEYKDGIFNEFVDKNSCLDFKCSSCSKCCEKKSVCGLLLSPFDVYNMSNALKLSCHDLIKNNYLKIGIGENLKNLPVIFINNDGKEKCIFLKDNKCFIYRYRPLICRTFPFVITAYDNKAYYMITTKIEGECKYLHSNKVKIKEHIKIENLDLLESAVIEFERLKDHLITLVNSKNFLNLEKSIKDKVYSFYFHLFYIAQKEIIDDNPYMASNHMIKYFFEQLKELDKMLKEEKLGRLY